jgi:hypothetical protein
MTFYDEQSSHSNFVLSFSRNPGKDFGAFAKGYRLAGDRLTVILINAQHFGDYEAYPVCFLYRHALELSLKQIISGSMALESVAAGEEVGLKLQCNHNLDNLAETAAAILLKCFSNDAELQMLVSRVRWTCKELTGLDERSEAFRYPVNKKGQATAKHHQIVNLEAFSTHVSSILKELEIVHFGLDVEVTRSKEIYEIVRTILLSPSDLEAD